MTMVINNKFVLKKGFLYQSYHSIVVEDQPFFHLQAQVFGIHTVDQENMCWSPKVCEKWTMFLSRGIHVK